MPFGKSICISPVSNFLVTFLNKLPVRYRWYLTSSFWSRIKKNIGHEYLFFLTTWKAPKLNIHILTENRQNIPIYGIISHDGDNRLIFSEMMMRSNMLRWIFIVLAHWNNSCGDRHVAPLTHIILIPSQSVFALSP